MGVWDHILAGILVVFQSDPVFGIPVTLAMVLEALSLVLL